MPPILRLLLFPFLAVAVAAAAAAQGASLEQRLDAVKEFKRYFRKFKEVSQKVEAIHTLRDMECVPACDELLRLIDAREEEIRAAATEVLAGYGSPATWEHVIAGLEAASDRAARIDLLGRAGIKSAAPVLLDLATGKRQPDAETRYAIARAFGRLGYVAGQDLLIGFLQDDDLRVRAAAADAIAALRLKPAGQALIPLFQDKAWQVQAAAIQAAGVVRPPEAILPLIDVLREEGRLQVDAADALFLITTKDFGTDPGEWDRQMRRLLDLGWRPPTDEEVEKAKAVRKKSAEFYGQRDKVTTFAGIPTTSRQVLFIIDVSGSMADLVVEHEKFQGYADYSKLTIVKTELVNTIDSLAGNTYFNIVAFATDLKTWKRFLAPANITNKESAKSWVDNLRAIGGAADQELASVGLASNVAEGKTNTFKALMYPFGIDPDQPRRAATTAPSEVQKRRLDTVYFLSDGRPSVGKLIDTEEIRQAVKAENEVNKIVIHTIAIGEFQKAFLESVAIDSGGVFVDLGR